MTLGTVTVLLQRHVQVVVAQLRGRLRLRLVLVVGLRLGVLLKVLVLIVLVWVLSLVVELLVLVEVEVLVVLGGVEVVITKVAVTRSCGSSHGFPFTWADVSGGSRCS